MSNDVLISIPLFVFMGYRSSARNLIDKLFRSCTSRWRACRRAGGGHAVHLRGVRHGHRHRRRGGHADGPAGDAAMLKAPATT